MNTNVGLIGKKLGNTQVFNQDGTVARVTVILVGHGPVADDKNRAWLDTMGRHAETLRKKGGFMAVRATTLLVTLPATFVITTR